MRRSQHRIDRDIRKCKYDPNKNYGSKWMYFEHMKFLELGTKPRSIKGYKSNDNDSDQGSNFHNNENSQLDSEISSVYHGDQRSNKLQIQWPTLLGPPPLRRFDAIKRNASLNDSDNTACYIAKPKSTYYQINFLEDSDKEELLMRSTTSNHCGNEDKSSSNDNESSKHSPYPQFQDVDNMCIKIEPDIEIEADIYPMDNEESNSSHGKQYRKENSLKSPPAKKLRVMDKNSTPKPKGNKPSERSNFLNDHAIAAENLLIPTRPPLDIGDPDNNFLISFSSHMKSMSQFQNLQFRAKMSDLILNILTTSLNANTSKPLENNKHLHQKALVEIRDPDCNFLISFLPYVKSMCQLQNLQFRAKMSELMLTILSTSLAANTSDSTTEDAISNNILN
ncbi:uncharacterized protein LOC135954778 [Calliphora vicina]|uniref:uncharacterized protein LOC135954778 n=1 Tax=Calliphora vicina TaxID=7373 RepID=UPI00325B2D93